MDLAILVSLLVRVILVRLAFCAHMQVLSKYHIFNGTANAYWFDYPWLVFDVSFDSNMF